MCLFLSKLWLEKYDSLVEFGKNKGSHKWSSIQWKALLRNLKSNVAQVFTLNFQFQKYEGNIYWVLTTIFWPFVEISFIKVVQWHVRIFPFVRYYFAIQRHELSFECYIFDTQEGSEDSDSDQNNQSDSDSKSDNANSTKSHNSSDSESDSKSEKSDASAAQQSNGNNSPKYNDSDDGKSNVTDQNNAATSGSGSSDRYVCGENVGDFQTISRVDEASVDCLCWSIWVIFVISFIFAVYFVFRGVGFFGTCFNFISVMISVNI